MGHTLRYISTIDKNLGEEIATALTRIEAYAEIQYVVIEDGKQRLIDIEK